MKKYKKFLTIVLIILIFDQTTKLLISNNLTLNKSIEIIPKFFEITYTRNFGAAWSMMWNKTSILIVVSIIALSIISYIIIKEKKLNNYKNIYYGFLVGGILGNLLDRIIRGYVIDFLDFNIFGYDFPIFNISDSFIVIGVLLIFIESLFGGEKNE